MRIQLAIFFCAILGSFALSGSPQSSQKIPKDGFVPDKNTAVKIAEAILTPIYGAKQVEAEKPFAASLKGEVWTVIGHLSEGADGGVAEVRISKLTGEILAVSHGK
jgi:hypothetical protein